MMQRGTLGLFGVVLALAGFIYFYEQDTTSSGELEGREDRFVPAFSRDRLTGFVVVRGGETVEVARHADDAGVESFTLVRPVRADTVDEDTVDTLVSALEWADATRTLTSVASSDLRRYGLDRPRVRVTLVLGERRIELAFGAEDPTHQGVYATSSDAEGSVTVIGKDVFAAVDHDASAFRVRRLLPSDLGAASRVSVRTREGVVAVALTSGVWWTEGAARARAARDKVEALVTALRDVSVLRFAPASLTEAQAGLSAPSSSVEAKLGERRVLLVVGGPCEGGRYARVDRGPIGCVSEETLTVLVPSRDALVERRVVSAGNDAIKGLTLTDGTRTLTVTESEAAFRYELSGVGAQEAGAVEPEALAEMLDALRAAPALNVRGADAAAGRTFAAKLTTVLRDGPSDVVELSLDADPPLARRPGEAAVLELPGAARALLMPSALSLRRRVLLEAPPESLTEVTITRGGVRETVRREATGAFVVTAPVAAPAEPSRAAALWTRLASLEAVRFVAEAPAPEHGLTGAGSRSVTLSLSGDDGHGHGDAAPSTHTLTLGAATDGGVFARLDAGAVFVLTLATVDLVDEPLVSRGLLLTEAVYVDAIALAGGETLRRRGSALVSESGAVPEARRAALLDAVSGLEAVKVVSYAPLAASFARPRARVTVRRSQEAPAPAEYVLLVGAQEGDRTHVRREDLAIDFLVPSDAVSAFTNATAAP